MATPEPLDDLTAGSVWRAHKLLNFKERARALAREARAPRWLTLRLQARALGIADDPAVLLAVRRMVEDTDALEALARRQRERAEPRPWWADGEYDDKRADDANDAGMACLTRKEHRAAYDAFTEAIRLSPRTAAYHANRAAVALQLGNAAGAAEDAEQAVKLCPGHLAAHLRAAKAYVALQQPERAVAHFEQVLALKPDHGGALSGRAAAAELAEQGREATQRAAASAMRGERATLPRQPLAYDIAADQLLAAEAMLRAQPNLEAAKCAHAEALILCRAYDAALEACSRLHPGSLDAAYLRAEAQWRAGKPDAASATLQEALARQPDATDGKCGDLAGFVKQLLADLAVADQAAARASTAPDAIATYSTLLQLETVEGTHMQATLLRLRGTVFASQGDTIRALADLDAALERNANDVEALVQRAQVHRAAGDVERCFLDLRAAHILAPQRPGLMHALQVAAKAALHRGSSRSSAEAPGTPVSASIESLPRSYRVLGIKLAATQREIAHAYRMLAAKWHPDKWATAPEDKQKLAEQRFRVVANAYETLRDPDARARHDREHFFSAAR